MKEPRRILDENPDELGAMLIRAAASESPSVDSKRRTLLALGLAAGTTAAAAKVGSGVAGTKVAGSLPLALVGKWAGVGIIVGGLAVGGAAIVESLSEPPSRGAASAVAPPTSAFRAAKSQVDHTQDRPIVEEQRELEAPAASLPPMQTTAPLRSGAIHVDLPTAIPPPIASSEPETTSALAAELALVDRVRAKLRAGDATEALRLLDRRNADHPRGALGIEATVLRIEALVLSGDRAQARSIGRTFLKRHPQTPLAERVKRAIGRGTPEGEDESP